MHTNEIDTSDISLLHSSIVSAWGCIRITSLTLILFIIASAGNADEDNPEYFVLNNYELGTSELPRRSEGDDLYADLNGLKLLITNENLQFMPHKSVHSIIDLDEDGSSEVILEMHNGGNCCGYEYAIISKRADNFFSVIENEKLSGASFPRLEIVEIGGHKLLEVVNNSEGVDNTSQTQTISLLKFEYGQLRLVSESQNAAFIPAIVEVNSFEFDQDNPAQIIQQLHVDSDGKLDKLICDYWSRWGDVVCDVDSSEFGYQDLSLGCDRVGVLSSKSNGMNDLVCNRVSILTFNGAEYVIIDE